MQRVSPGVESGNEPRRGGPSSGQALTWARAHAPRCSRRRPAGRACRRGRERPAGPPPAVGRPRRGRADRGVARRRRRRTARAGLRCARSRRGAAAPAAARTTPARPRASGRSRRSRAGGRGRGWPRVGHARPRKRTGRRDRVEVGGAVHRQRGPRCGYLDRTYLRRGRDARRSCDHVIRSASVVGDAPHRAACLGARRDGGSACRRLRRRSGEAARDRGRRGGAASMVVGPAAARSWLGGVRGRLSAGGAGDRIAHARRGRPAGELRARSTRLRGAQTAATASISTARPGLHGTRPASSRASSRLSHSIG